MLYSYLMITSIKVAGNSIIKTFANKMTFLIQMTSDTTNDVNDQ